MLPLYANTHTETSSTGLQTTRFREDARRLIRTAVGGTDQDVVIFCGSGATGAINKLVDILNLRLPRELDERYDLSGRIPAGERPVVFIGPYEHHSNELPWRETIAEVVTIAEDQDGRIDQEQLAQELRRFAARPLRIGSFSAASNVTGIVSDTAGISRLLHAHGAQILRVKGLLNVEGAEAPVVVHGVQQLVHPPSHLERWPTDDHTSRLVFIVRGLEPQRIQESLTRYLGDCG